ncbi:MAG: class I SAM-dependent methyltransferase [Campylobacterales bacterium]|nr:class I SAM-dependent methyltransferase [Campylobacterales bacterium]
MPRIDCFKFYENNLLEFGANAKGVGWSSEQNQQIRFEIIYSFLEKFSNISIVDAGCGFGDFYQFLNSKDFLCNYIGIDKQLDFINIAKSRYGSKFLYLNILENRLLEADFFVASGSLNLLLEDETYQFIEKCFNHSKKGFIFNLLKKNNKYTSHHFNYQEPHKIASFCKQFTKKIEYIEGYIKHDFTIAMFK